MKTTDLIKEGIIAKFHIEDEYYGPWFKCSCGNSMIVDESNFCNMCGQKIELDPEWFKEKGKHWGGKE